MGEVPSMCPNLNDKTKFRLDEINKIEDYFIAEICKGESMNKKLSKYIAALDYFDKAVISFSVTSEGETIASFASVIDATAEITSASFCLVFSSTTEIVNKPLKATRNKKKTV